MGPEFHALPNSPRPPSAGWALLLASRYSLISGTTDRQFPREWGAGTLFLGHYGGSSAAQPRPLRSLQGAGPSHHSKACVTPLPPFWWGRVVVQKMAVPWHLGGGGIRPEEQACADRGSRRGLARGPARACPCAPVKTPKELYSKNPYGPRACRINRRQGFSVS